MNNLFAHWLGHPLRAIWKERTVTDIKIESKQECTFSTLYGLTLTGEEALCHSGLALADDGFGWMAWNSSLPDLIEEWQQQQLIIA